MLKPYKEPWLFKIIPWFIGFVFIVIVAFWIVAGTLAYKGINAVSESGLKSVVDQIWNGSGDKK